MKHRHRLELGVLAAIMFLFAVCGLSIAQNVSSDEAYYVANTRPPDAFLALRTNPTTASGQRIANMPNGTPLKVLKRRGDGWWYVRVLPSGLEGWALSRQGISVWIVCCASDDTLTVPKQITQDSESVEKRAERRPDPSVIQPFQERVRCTIDVLK